MLTQTILAMGLTDFEPFDLEMEIFVESLLSDEDETDWLDDNYNFEDD